MSVLIKGVIMPDSCETCVLDNGINCMAYPPSEDMVYDTKDGRPEWCPLVAVPDHGLVIDAKIIQRVMDGDIVSLALEKPNRGRRDDT